MRILDEPTSALDADAARRMLDLIYRAADDGTAVLLITHEDRLNPKLIDQALTLADQQLHPDAVSRRIELSAASPRQSATGQSAQT